MPPSENPYESPESSAELVAYRGRLPAISIRQIAWSVAGGAVGACAFIACVALIHLLTQTFAGKTPERYFGDRTVSFENQFYIALILLCLFVTIGLFLGWRIPRRRKSPEVADCDVELIAESQHETKNRD